MQGKPSLPRTLKMRVGDSNCQRSSGKFAVRSCMRFSMKTTRNVLVPQKWDAGETYSVKSA
jgi:hypothetical protein